MIIPVSKFLVDSEEHKDIDPIDTKIIDPNLLNNCSLIEKSGASIAQRLEQQPCKL
jgi:hypothetical protein